GIRDFHVTGVQTCALPISRDARGASRGAVVASGRRWRMGRSAIAVGLGCGPLGFVAGWLAAGSLAASGSAPAAAVIAERPASVENGRAAWRAGAWGTRRVE